MTRFMLWKCTQITTYSIRLHHFHFQTCIIRKLVIKKEIPNPLKKFSSVLNHPVPYSWARVGSFAYKGKPLNYTSITTFVSCKLSSRNLENRRIHIPFFPLIFIRPSQQPLFPERLELSACRVLRVDIRCCSARAAALQCFSFPFSSPRPPRSQEL